MLTGLSARSISKSFPTRGGDLVVLEDVSLELAGGESVAIMGPSGSGKSTLLNILGTLEEPTSGEVSIDGQNPFSLPARELARFRNHRIGLIFQDHHLLGSCSVLENVLLPTLADTGGDGRANDVIERALELLARVGLSERHDHRPAELSGGERQRSAIARALINRPSLLLADEPTGNLDRATAREIAALLREIQTGDGVTLVVVTHSRELAGQFQRTLELVDGRLAAPRGL